MHNCDIWYQTFYENSDFSFGKVSLKDISMNGMMVQMDEFDEVGVSLLLNFYLHGYNKKITITGKVVWVKKIDSERCNVGIQFIKIVNEDKAAISKFIDSKQAYYN